MPEETAYVDDSRDPVAASWMRRIHRANKYYDNWTKKFNCDQLEEYYYGFQWKDGSPSTGYERYVINFVFSNIEIKKPSLLFQNAAFRIKPKPANAEFDFMASALRARNREDALNTIIQDEDQEFNEEFEAFVTDAFFRFGIMEIGYSANWIENPNAGKPILKSDNDPYIDPDVKDGSDNVIREPEEIPEEEHVYFKRIPPWRFRVGGTDGRTFKKCSWVGYYDFYRVEDLKSNRALKNLDKLEYSGARSDDFADEGLDAIRSEDSDLGKTGDLIKVWTIYDIRQKKKIIVCASNTITLLEKKYKKFPLVSLKFINKVRGWYPLPMVFNWKGPQDEINDAREQQRIHRKRSSRRYLYADQAFADDGEISKLESGPDMTFAKTQGNPRDKVVALENAPLDPVIAQSMAVSRDDMYIISATASERLGDRVTATQTASLDQKSQVRETAARLLIANTLKKIGRIAIMTIQEHFTSDFWVKVRTDLENEGFMEEVKMAREEWRSLTSGDLGDSEDFEVDISLDTISPIENQASKAAYIEFLTLLTQFPQLAFDPILVRETAYRCNYRNEKVISRMAQMAQVAALGQMEQAKQSLAQQGMPVAPGNNGAQTRMAQMQPPNSQQMGAQLSSQVPVQ